MSDSTPTPWRILGGMTAGYSAIYTTDRERCVVLTQQDGVPLEEHRANLRLIVEAVNNYSRLRAIEAAYQRLHKIARTISTDRNYVVFVHDEYVMELRGALAELAALAAQAGGEG